MMKVAQGFDQKVNGKDVKFGVGDVTGWQNFLKNHALEVPEDNQPVCAAFDDQATKYLMTSKFTVDNFREFLQQWVDRKLEPHMKTEEITLEDNAGLALVNLTRKNFAQYIDGSRDTFIKFYRLKKNKLKK